MHKQSRFAIAAALFVSFTATMASIGSANAQAWPTRPVRLIVSLAPGSGVDIGARLLAERLTARWGEPVIVENRPGGDAVVAINAFIGSHDDHTLLYTPTSSITAHPFGRDSLPYDPRELAPVAKISETLLGLVVSPALGVGSVGELIERIRARPGQLNYSTGTGMSDIIYDGYFKSAGLAITRVPYRDIVSPMTDLAEGRIQAYMAGLAVVQPHVQAGRAKLIAVTNSRRAAALPGIPTVAEAGYPALTFDGLVGLFGQRDMTPAARERIGADIRAVFGDPAIAARLAATGTVVTPGDGAEFAAALAEQHAKLAEIAKTLGIKPTSK